MPTAPDGREGKTDAMKSAVSLAGKASVMAAIVWEEDPFDFWADFARRASWVVRVLYPFPEIVVRHWCARCPA